jgi:hypothetical protein
LAFDIIRGFSHTPTTFDEGVFMDQETYHFTLTPQDSTLDERRIRELLESITAEAVEQAMKDGDEVEAKADLQGGFGGLGEIAAVLIFLAKSGAVAKVVATAEAGATLAAKGLVEGASSAAGIAFFNKYLKPRLIKKNILPSDLQSAPSPPKTTAKVPKAEGKKGKGRRANQP